MHRATCLSTAPVRRILFLVCALLSGCALNVGRPTRGEPVSFETMKSLVGRWETKRDKNGAKEVVVYRLTSGGAAIEETIFPGTPHEMVSVYYPTKYGVEMTHYCAIGNRPQFQGSQLSPGEIDFQYISTRDIDPTKDNLMNRVAFRILDDKHLYIKWSGLSAGKPQPDKEVSLRRVR